MDGIIKCPVCGSEHVYASKRGFNYRRAFWTAAITDDKGLSFLSGALGKNKIVITCPRCGHQFSSRDLSSIRYIESDAEVEKLPAVEEADQEADYESNYYACPCGKVSLLEGPNPKCPQCGEPLTRKDIFTPNKVGSQSSGCGCFVWSLFLILMALLFCFCLKLLN